MRWRNHGGLTPAAPVGVRSPRWNLSSFASTLPAPWKGSARRAMLKRVCSGDTHNHEAISRAQPRAAGVSPLWLASTRLQRCSRTQGRQSAEQPRPRLCHCVSRATAVFRTIVITPPANALAEPRRAYTRRSWSSVWRLRGTSGVSLVLARFPHHGGLTPAAPVGVRSPRGNLSSFASTFVSHGGLTLTGAPVHVGASCERSCCSWRWPISRMRQSGHFSR